MSLQWNELTASGLFTWFGVHETGRTASATGTTIICAPGSFVDHIALAFEIDAGAVVRHAELATDRAWMEGARTAPFAVDIVKSFILTFAQDDPLLSALGQQIEQKIVRLPGVISRAQAQQALAPALQSAIAPALAVYEGREARAALAAQQHTLVLVNETATEPHRCRVSWTASYRHKTAGSFWRRVFARR